MIKPQGGRQKGFQADSTVFCFRPRMAFGFHVLRVMIGADDVDCAIGNSRDHRLPVVFVAQRWRHLEERPIGADVVFIVGQVIDRHPGGDVQPFRLACSNHVCAVGGGNEVCVVLALGHGNQAQVPLQHDDFRFTRHTGKTFPTGVQPCVHDPAGEVRSSVWWMTSASKSRA